MTVLYRLASEEVIPDHGTAANGRMGTEESEALELTARLGKALATKSSRGFVDGQVGRVRRLPGREGVAPRVTGEERTDLCTVNSVLGYGNFGSRTSTFSHKYDCFACQRMGK